MSSLPSLALYGLLLLEFAYGAIYLDQWAVQVEGGVTVAKELAERHGFTYVHQIMPDHYLLRHKRVVKRSVYASPHHSTSLSKEPQVKWLEQQVVKRRVKRDSLFNDPKWPRMWYLRRGAHLDMNVKPAWRKGISGKGVVVTILDDGIEKDHPDLKKNYDPLASYDVNNHDPDPQPRYDYTNENRHGTRCAGEVAAEANNGICSVGVAYGAGIGGVRMLDGDVTDAVEATSLSLRTQHIHIYSASWGPDDDGRTVDGPAALAKKAFYDGINKGRGGKGSIFVWASGNGGRDRDNCNCDGYTNSIYTLSISSATENGNIPWYSEACSSTLATTYSSGSGGERQIVTTDLRKGCTETHTGTSASAPLAAGICALALEANPRLTWRDMQHIVVRTARTANLRASDWVTNGVGRRVSHSFGYGLMDASAMVDLARNWTNVPPQHMCEIHSMDAAKQIPVDNRIQVHIESDGCIGRPNFVRYLEHVQAKITLTSSRRGEIQLYLISPFGTRSTLLAKRTRDTSQEGFNDWAFMSTHNWGELSMGRWTLEIENGASSSEIKTWTLVLHGTAAHPQSGKSPPDLVDKVCKAGQYYLHKFCYAECPANFFGTTEIIQLVQNGTNVTTSKPVLVCKPCTSFCLKCRGHAVFECVECAHGYELSPQSMCVRKYVWNFVDKDLLSFLLIAVGFCLSTVVLFFLLFGILEMRTKGYCCFRKRNGEEKGQANGAVLADEQKLLESDSDEDDVVFMDTSLSNNHNAEKH